MQVETQRKLLIDEFARIAPRAAPNIVFDVDGVGTFNEILRSPPSKLRVTG